MYVRGKHPNMCIRSLYKPSILSEGVALTETAIPDQRSLHCINRLTVDQALKTHALEYIILPLDISRHSAGTLTMHSASNYALPSFIYCMLALNEA